LLVLCCFFLSGFCGLVYQVIWMRLIGHVFGNSVFATATVLAAFMGGLALGSYLGGTVADRHSARVRLYGILEVCIGLFCIVLPFLLDAAAPIYAAVYRRFDGTSAWLHLVRAVTCGLVLLIPTTCMGATLPLLLRHFVQTRETLGWTVGLVYAVNTFGAVAGCVLTGFVLIPALGLSRTTAVAIVVNIVVGLAAIVFLEERRKGEAEPATAGETVADDDSRGGQQGQFSTWEARAALAAFGVSGVAAMIDEVALTRAFSLVLGSSTYAFSVMLTAFILGIGLGSIVLARWVKPDRDLVFGMAIAQWGIGVSTLAMVVMIGELPRWVVSLIGHYRSSFAALQVFEFLYLFALMLIPTCLMGLMFPLTTAIWTRRPQSVGRSSGEAYFVNTFGAIAGSLLGGFLLLPAIGVQKALFVAAALNVANAAWVLASHRRWRPALKAGVALGSVVLALAFGVLVPPWNLDELTSGPYLYASTSIQPGETAKEALQRELRQQGEILWTRDGTACTVTVKKTSDNILQLLLNGKTDASTRGDDVTQKLFGHIPMLLHPKPEKVLVIGLGCGMTLASALTHGPERADCLEISREVVFAAGKYFSKFNDDCLNNTRTRVIIGDGRNHVALTDQTYDVITSEPSNPWIAGIGSLFTAEFWTLCRERLSDDGVMCQWVQSYQMDLATFRLIVRTFRGVFPNCTLWVAEPFDFMLIGSKSASPVSFETLRARLSRESVASDLKLARIEDVEGLLSHFAAGADAVSALAGHGGLHTDDNARLEFEMPRHMYSTNLDVYLALDPRVRPALEILAPDSLSADAAERLALAHRRRWHLQMSHVLLKARRYDDALSRLEKAREADARDPEGLFGLFNLLQARARTDYEAGDPAKARKHLARLIELYPDIANLASSDHPGVRSLFDWPSSLNAVYAEFANNLGEMLRVEAMETNSPEMIEESMKAFRFAREPDPKSKRANTNLGALLVVQKRHEEAIPHFLAVLETEPAQAGPWLNLGAAREGAGEEDEAEKCYREAMRLDARSVPALLRLAGLCEKRGRVPEAVQCYQSVLKLQPTNATALSRLKSLKQDARDDAAGTAVKSPATN
jgi:spermidine synthase